MQRSAFHVRRDKAALFQILWGDRRGSVKVPLAKHELNGDRDVDLSAGACRPGRDCHAFCRRRRLSATSPPLSALGAPSCGVSCCSFPDGAEPAFDRGRQLFLRAGAHPARPRRRIAAGIAMRSRHCSRRRRCGSPQQFSGTSRSAAQGPRAADSPVEGDGFEPAVPLKRHRFRATAPGLPPACRPSARNMATASLSLPFSKVGIARPRASRRIPDKMHRACVLLASFI